MNKSLYEFHCKKNTIQSDSVLVILGYNYFLLNIYIKHLQTLIYISKYYKFNVNIYIIQ